MKSDTFYTVVYCHGKGGHPWNGKKITLLKRVILANGMNLVSIPYEECDTVADMVDQTVAICLDKAMVPDKLILIGSSRGGFIAASASHILAQRSNQVDGVFLLAPAIFDDNTYYPTAFVPPVAERVSVLHGYDDEVVPVAAVWRFCMQNGAQAHFVKDGHRLANSGVLMTALIDEFLNGFLIVSKALSRR